MAEAANPAQRTLDAELDSIAFVIGVEQGRWEVLKYDFPHLYVRVRAVHEGVEFAQDFHLICDGYPMPGPLVERWSFAANARPLAPSGPEFSPAFLDALKDWEHPPGSHGGIYRGWQRLAAPHGDWAQRRPDWAWHPDRKIGFILENMFDVVAEQARYRARTIGP